MGKSPRTSSSSWFPCYILPLILMVSVSFTEENAIVSGSFSWFPHFSTEVSIGVPQSQQLIDL